MISIKSVGVSGASAEIQDAGGNPVLGVAKATVTIEPAEETVVLLFHAIDKVEIVGRETWVCTRPDGTYDAVDEIRFRDGRIWRPNG